jgi:phospholipid/cholesterol/gamma-HCH transport system substrate-binding protein
MANAPRRRPVRFAAVVLACLLAAFGVFTYLAYSAAFVSTATVTVTTSRAGLMLNTGAKVKYRGIQVGKVEGIDYTGDQAKLTLAIDTGQLRYIPSNARARISGNTVFGAKAVEFLPPAEPSPTPLQPGASVQTSAVQLEVNTLFETLIELLHKIDPVNLNATLAAIGEGLRNHGEDLGAALAGLNQYLLQVNPKLPTVRSDFAQTAMVANTYADASQDLVTVLHDAATIADTVVEERDNLNATLLAAIGLADNGTSTLEPAADNYIAAIQRLRAPLKVLGDY